MARFRRSLALLNLLVALSLVPVPWEQIGRGLAPHVDLSVFRALSGLKPALPFAWPAEAAPGAAPSMASTFPQERAVVQQIGPLGAGRLPARAAGVAPEFLFTDSETKGPGVLSRLERPSEPMVSAELRLKGVGGRSGRREGNQRVFDIPAETAVGGPDGLASYLAQAAASSTPMPSPAATAPATATPTRTPGSVTATVQPTSTPAVTAAATSTPPAPGATAAATSTPPATATLTPTAPVVATATATPGTGPSVGNRYGARIEIRYESTAGSVKETLLLHDRPRTNVLEYQLDADGLTVSPQADGSLRLLDHAERHVFTIAAPTLADARGVKGTASYRLAGNKLEVVLDAGLVASGALPLEVDPSIFTAPDLLGVSTDPIQGAPWQRQSAVAKDGNQLIAYFDPAAAPAKGIWFRTSADNFANQDSLTAPVKATDELGKGGFSVEVDQRDELLDGTTKDVVYVAASGAIGSTNYLRIVPVTYACDAAGACAWSVGTPIDVKTSATTPNTSWSGAGLAIERGDPDDPTARDYLWLTYEELSGSQYRFRASYAELTDSPLSASSFVQAPEPPIVSTAVVHYGSVVALKGGVAAIYRDQVRDGDNNLVNEQRSSIFTRGGASGTWDTARKITAVAFNNGREYSATAVPDPRSPDQANPMLAPVVAYALPKAGNANDNMPIKLYFRRYLEFGWQNSWVESGSFPASGNNDRRPMLSSDGLSWYLFRRKTNTGTSSGTNWQINGQRGRLTDGRSTNESRTVELEGERSWIVEPVAGDKDIRWLSLPAFLPSEIIPFFWIRKKGTTQVPVDDELMVQAKRIDMLGERTAWQYQDVPIAGGGVLRVNLANGNLHYEMDDAIFPARIFNDHLKRAYDSQRTSVVNPTAAEEQKVVGSLTPFGPGWTGLATPKLEFFSNDTKQEKLSKTTNRIVYWTGDGGKYLYLGKGGKWTAELGLKTTITKGSGIRSWKLRDVHGNELFFDDKGKPTIKQDHDTSYGSIGTGDNHAWVWTYANGKLDKITGSTNTNKGRVQDVTIASVGGKDRLTQVVVTTPAAGANPAAGLTYTYEYNGPGNRLSKAALPSPDGQVVVAVEYGYDAGTGRLTSVKAPEGGLYTITYDEAGRVTAIDLPDPGVAGASVTCDKGAGRHCWEFAWQEGINQATLTDPRGKAWSYKALGSGPVYEQTYPLGLNSGQTATITRTWSAEYNKLREVLPVDDSRSATTVWTYDTKRNVLSIKDAENHTTSFRYNDFSRVVEKTDARGNLTAYTYKTSGSAQRRRETVTDAEGGTVRTVYDDLVGDIIKEVWVLVEADATSTREALTKYDYDDWGQRTRERRPDGSVTQYTRDPWGRVTEVRVDSDTPTVTTDDKVAVNVYDALGRLKQSRVRMSNADSNSAADLVTQVTYDRDGNVRTTTDPQGGTTTFSVDLRGRLTAVSSPPGNDGTDAHRPCVQFDYDQRGNQRQVRTAVARSGGSACAGATDVSAWSVVSREFDDRGLKIEERLEGTAVKTTWAYNRAGWVVEARDPNRLDSNSGRPSATYSHNLVGKKTLEQRDVTVDGALATAERSWSYDPVYNVASETVQRTADRAEDAVRTFTYDRVQRLTEALDELGRKTTAQYNKAGWKQNETDPPLQGKGRPSREWEYDDLGRVTAAWVTLSATEKAVTRTTYDEFGNRKSLTDPDLNVTTYQFDRANRVEAIVSPLPLPGGGLATVRQAYDKNGNRTSLTDPEGKVHQADYDALNRLRWEKTPPATATVCTPGCSTSAVERQANYTYTLDGLLKDATDFNGAKTTYSYEDATRRLSGIDYPARTTDVQFGYDPSGNRTTMTELSAPAVTTTAGFDELGRLTQADRAGQIVRYAYDRRDPKTVTYPDQKVVTYGFDKLGRPRTVDDWRGSGTGRASYAYDDGTNTRSLALPNGTTSTWAYDDGGRLKNVQHQASGAPTPFAKYSYRYDPAGNRLEQTSEDAAGTVKQTFSYDQAHRLTSETRDTGQPSVAYGYDARGNRTTVTTGGTTRTWSYDDDNRLLGIDDGTSFQYDPNGSLLSKTVPGVGPTTYVYDAARRLTDVTPPSGSAVHFEYDGAGARLKKRVGPPGSPEASYVNDSRGLTQVLHETGPNAQGTTRTLSYIPGLLQHDGTPGLPTQDQYLSFHADAQNNRVLTNGAGTVVNTWTYDPFGVVRNADPDDEKSAFQYAGEQKDLELGLINLRARSYDPALGRFLQRDVVAGRPGFPQSLNRYTYAVNNPLRFVDPSGYTEEEEEVNEEEEQNCLDIDDESVRARLCDPNLPDRIRTAIEALLTDASVVDVGRSQLRCEEPLWVTEDGTWASTKIGPHTVTALIHRRVDDGD